MINNSSKENYEIQDDDFNSVNLLDTFNKVKLEEIKSNPKALQQKSDNFATFGSNTYQHKPQQNSNVDYYSIPNEQKMTHFQSLERITEKDDDTNFYINGASQDPSKRMVFDNACSTINRATNDMNEYSSENMQIFNATQTDDFEMDSNDFKEYSMKERNYALQYKFDENDSWKLQSRIDQSLSRSHDIKCDEFSKERSRFSDT